MIKAIVSVETKEMYYGMEYTEVEKYTYIAETKEWLLNLVYKRHYHGYENIKIEMEEVIK